MFLPLHDGVPLKNLKTPLATRVLIGICILAYLLTFYGPVGADAMVGGLGFIPSVLFGTEALPEGYPFVPVQLTLVTNIFLHGSFFHLIGNMLFLWVFGDNVEDAMGHLRFIMFYLMCGIFAAVVHSWIMPKSELPLIGASGAVAGSISAYLNLHPKVKVWVLALWRIPIKITAYWALGFWILAQFANLLFDTEESVAWGAHIGGLVAGAVLILFMRRRGVPLFDKTRGGA